MADPADNLNLIDRLSSLPELILLHILSFLPTKMAVKTSVLSKPWQQLWTLVPAIDLDDRDYNWRTFEGIVSKVLDGNKAPIIRRFRLEGSSFSISSFDKWVSSATQQRNVEELDLTFSGSPGRGPSIYAFCCAPESRKTLVIMKLTIFLHHEYDDHPQFVIGGHLDFPTLKVLHINTAVFESQDPSLSGFFPSRFPLLEELVLHKTTFQHDINISLPVLRRLKIHCFSSRSIRKYTLNLEAPSLRYLVLREFRCAGFRVEHLSNLVEANVDVFYNLQDYKHDEYGESLIDFVNALSDVMRLILSAGTMHTMQALRNSASFHVDRIQSFQNLVELDLQLDGSVLDMTMAMLSKFINLVHLKITKDARYYRTGYDSDYDLALQEHVPYCLTCHLKTFCFSYFEGSEYEEKFAEYILKNSLVLENAKIRFGPRLIWKTGCDNQKTLSTTSKGSSECQIEFDQITELEYRKLKGRYDYSDSE